MLWSHPSRVHICTIDLSKFGPEFVGRKVEIRDLLYTIVFREGSNQFQLRVKYTEEKII